jgi:hypothetical protein
MPLSYRSILRFAGHDRTLSQCLNLNNRGSFKWLTAHGFVSSQDLAIQVNQSLVKTVQNSADAKIQIRTIIVKVKLNNNKNAEAGMDVRYSLENTFHNTKVSFTALYHPDGAVAAYLALKEVEYSADSDTPEYSKAHGEIVEIERALCGIEGCCSCRGAIRAIDNG